MFYECHITLDSKGNQFIKDIVEGSRWSYSKIDGDPSLGSGVFEYATWHASHAIPIVSIINTMNTMAAALRNLDVKVLRQKVELVVYDTKGQL